ncbi:MAG TPA: hypothetical protein DD418_20030 [Pseudomonas sp.]|nr:hypothetical protein [Pseudomonas sp.]
MAPATPVFAGTPAPTGTVQGRAVISPCQAQVRGRSRRSLCLKRNLNVGAVTVGAGKPAKQATR